MPQPRQASRKLRPIRFCPQAVNMDRDPERAEELKNEGNAAFKAKNFIAAESLYSKA